MICVLIQVPLVNGKPDLGLPNSVDVVREGRTAHVSWGDDRVLTLRFLGTSPNGPVFCGMMSPRVAVALAHLGAGVMRLKDAWLNPTLKTWLLANGVTDVGGFPRPPHVMAGDSTYPDGAPTPGLL